MFWLAAQAATTKTIPAGVFKQGGLRLLDEVAETHREIVITKRGAPVARLVPVKQEREREEEILATLRRRAGMFSREGVPAAVHGGSWLGPGRRELIQERSCSGSVYV